MNRITPLDPARATGKAKTLLDGVRAKLGAVPNLLRTLGNSPAALQGYLAVSSALSAGKFTAGQREQIALTVAETNLCSYCLSAHSFLGDKVGLSEKDILNARSGTAADATTDAILKFARNVVVNRGEVKDDDLTAAREAGLNDEDLIEAVAHVSFNILTNYVNHVAQTTIDFPEIKPGKVATAVAS